MNPASNARSTRKVVAAVVLATAALAGCMPAHRDAPALARITTPQDWTTSSSASASTRNSDVPVNAQWWQAFGDTTLNRYIEAARAYNTDLLPPVRG